MNRTIYRFLNRIGIFSIVICVAALSEGFVLVPSIAQTHIQLKQADSDPQHDPERKRELERLVRMLADPSYQKRELAMRKLIDAGTEAIAPLEASMRDGNLELVDRASSILQDLALVETPEDEGIAWKALERLQQNGPGAASTRAYSSLTLIRRERIKRAFAKLDSSGIKVGVQIFEHGNTSFTIDMISVNDQWNGDTEIFGYFPWLYSAQMAYLQGSAVTGPMLEAIATIPSIKQVRLHDGKLSAEELRKLKGLKRFDLLELHFCEIGNGDEDLFALAEMPVRQEMIITGTDFDIEDYNALKVERSDLQITFSRGGFLGVQCTPSLPTCVVSSTVLGGAAYRAGIIAGDVIVKLGEHDVKRFEDLQNAVRRYRSGQEIEVKVMRVDRELSFTVQLGRLD